jgi:hypothetical protein
MLEQGCTHLEHNHGPDETVPERPSPCGSPLPRNSNRGQGFGTGESNGTRAGSRTGSTHPPRLWGPSRRSRMVVPATHA